MQAVILAGGLGTRLRPFTDEKPKPMYPVGGKPFVARLIEQIRGFGIWDVLMLLGYKPECIIDYLGDGDRYGLHIEYDVTPVEYNTGGRLLHARDAIADSFLLMYCDNYCPVDYRELLKDFIQNDASIQLSVYTNKDKYTRDNLAIENGRVSAYDKSRKAPGLSGVDIGYALCKKSVLDYLTGDSQSFEALVYPELVKKKTLFATKTDHRYYSVGSWERINLTEQFFSDSKTVFLDRDGTINERPPRACYVERAEDFRWLPGAIDAIRLLKEHGYRVILISNQPGLARGNLTEEALSSIHKKMQEDLKRETGFEIDDILYCPHNWDDGCECRKPKPGLLYEAQRKYSLNLTKCAFFGDDERDMLAANAARCKGVLISDDYSLLDAVNDLVDKREKNTNESFGCYADIQ